MKPRTRFDTHSAFAGFSLVILAAIAFFALLAMIARPRHYGERVEAVQSRLDDIERITHASSRPWAYPPGAVCSGPAEAGAEALKQRIALSATAAGVSVAEVSTAPGYADAGIGGLTPVSLQVAATGRYDFLVDFLAALAAGRPQIFVETGDLTSKVSSAELKLTGRVFCSTSARP